MSLSTPFIVRPIGTSLVTLGIALVGLVAFMLLPISPLPQVDFPTVMVQASMPGASPEVMASSVATPLERHLGQIADVSEMTSGSSTGSTRVILQFNLTRDIDGAARDVQAAINAARADLPTSLTSNPTYRKMNPADAPILILVLNSKTLSNAQIYDSASTVIQQKLSQVNGVGQVTLGGGSSPAVRVEVNPHALFQHKIGLESVRAALAATNANAPKGAFEEDGNHFQIYANDQAIKADAYRNLIIAYRNNRPVRLSDIANVIDSVEDIRNMGFYNGIPSIPVIVFRQPGANIIDVVDKVKATLPSIRASIPAEIDIGVQMDRTTTIRASLRDVEFTLVLSIFLVVGVVFVFLRDTRSILIPSVAVPVSLIGTFGVMYLLGYSLDNLSLMALIVSSGFVVDDAIIVLENITRHLEAGMTRFQAALLGAKEVGFTVMSMSLSLIAVFLPIMLMGGIVGRLFREFAVTLSVAVLVSLVVSLTTTPMMCAHLLRERGEVQKDIPFVTAFLNTCGMAFAWLQGHYDTSLEWALRHGKTMVSVLGIVVVLNVYLFIVVPKGFFPQQDTGMMMGSIMADQSISFQLMQSKLKQMIAAVMSDPAIDGVTAFSGSQQINSGNMFVSLKPIKERKVSVDQVIGRLRAKTAGIEGGSVFMQPSQDIRMGGRPGSAQYQYTLQAADTAVLREWTPKLAEALKTAPGMTDVNADMQNGGLEVYLDIDRDAVARYGLSLSQIDNTLYDAFGQRQVSTIYQGNNQYHVVMEVDPTWAQDPKALQHIYISNTGGKTTAAGKSAATAGTAVSTSAETLIPLSSVAAMRFDTAPLSVNHQGHFAASTISFNLNEGKSLGDAVEIIKKTMFEIGTPSTLQGSFQGTAKAYQDTQSNQVLLIIAALVTVYLVLGILYESLIHPVTILSTLPSAGVGAVLALRAVGLDFTIMALIGVILLIGIVKKNAIMMIDFAIQTERAKNISPREAIAEACRLRFRPIMMTTMAAICGALPLAFGTSEGSELRQPLGIAIVGGLVMSQVLTLYTTPVIYLYLDRFRIWTGSVWDRALGKKAATGGGV